MFDDNQRTYHGLTTLTYMQTKLPIKDKTRSYKHVKMI